MKLEVSKTEIIRFGTDSNILLPTIKINNNEIPVNDHMKYLGYFLKDEGNFDYKFHLTKRSEQSNKYCETKLLDWVCKSYILNSRVKKM